MYQGYTLAFSESFPHTVDGLDFTANANGKNTSSDTLATVC
jgi:hypothetical protein